MQRLFTYRWFRFVVGLIALAGTVAMATYQRRTGPTWPLPVEISVGDAPVSGELIRTHAGAGDARVALATDDPDLTGEVVWRRYPTDDAWSRLPMTREAGESATELAAYLPHQPSSAKLEYSVRLVEEGREVVLPAEGTAVIRFRDEVPGWVLVPHILCMFLTLWLVFRAAIGALLGEIHVQRFIPWVVFFLLVGGFFLGPLVQKFAFDAWWTGWPFGGDWTDNKTLAALIAWLVAWRLSHSRPDIQRWAVVLATVVMIVVYLIPHSIHGSELDWEAMEGEAQSQEVSP